MSSSSEAVPNVTSNTITGRVKWFNNKTGYGFITGLSKNDYNGSDIFVHHSSIQVENEQYKYLVQGEYVEFQVIQCSDSEHEYQASNVTGILGGKCMCETMKEINQNKLNYRNQRSTTDSGFNGRSSGVSDLLDHQQQLSMPMLNVSMSGNDSDFTPVRNGRTRKPLQASSAETPRGGETPRAGRGRPRQTSSYAH